jgi:hypothetical protein
MAHKVFVDLDVNAVEVKAKDVVFKVYKRKKKFGELRVSRGAVVWRGRSDQWGRKLSWRRFDELMQSTARRAERRPPGARVSVPRRRLRG